MAEGVSAVALFAFNTRMSTSPTSTPSPTSGRRPHGQQQGQARSSRCKTSSRCSHQRVMLPLLHQVDQSLHRYLKEQPWNSYRSFCCTGSRRCSHQLVGLPLLHQVCQYHQLQELPSPHQFRSGERHHLQSLKWHHASLPSPPRRHLRLYLPTRNTFQ